VPLVLEDLDEIVAYASFQLALTRRLPHIRQDIPFDLVREIGFIDLVSWSTGQGSSPFFMDAVGPTTKSAAGLS
jgi:hypothetical protein